jgi:catechol 2,3-dioxygenase-like lactoylglutathione lyase family enzyme
VFISLDFIYMPASDFEAALHYYTENLQAELVWRVRGMGTIVAMLRLTGEGPPILLAEHLADQPPILVYRVPKLSAAVKQLKARGVRGDRFEIPHGPIFRFDAAGGQRFAVYELTRPEANTMWNGRIDP